MKKHKILVIVGIAVAVYQLRTAIVSNYHFNKSYEQLWNLSDKSSTIEAKHRYISQFVAALDAGNKAGEFSSHDAVWLRTPDNSFSMNLEALKTLASRLEEIHGMNPNSFEYNTAIQQITAQEQGEASSMIRVFRECYLLMNYPAVWGWISIIITTISLSAIIGGAIWWAVDADVV